MKPIFIAEIKTESPYGFKSGYARHHLIDTAIQFGDWVAVHTDPRYGGGFDDIYQIKRLTNKPVLAKGFHNSEDSINKARDMGADFILNVDGYRKWDPTFRKWWDRCFSNNSYKEDIIFEISRLEDVKKMRSTWTKGCMPKVIYNGRDLRTGIGKKYIGDYVDYRANTDWLCGASLIKTPLDVEMLYPNCNAFIVGEHLIDFCKHLQ